MTARLLAKVCGLTRRDDVLQARAAGADLLGFVRHPDSPRHCEALATLAPLAGRAGVLVIVADSAQPVLDELAHCGLTRVQPYFPRAQRAEAVARLRDAGFFVLLPWADAPDQPAVAADLYVWETAREVTGVHGGSGQPHAAAFPPPGDFLLAGGMSAATFDARVAALDPTVRPRLRGADAASRLEMSPGVKDAAHVTAFINQVHAHVV